MADHSDRINQLKIDRDAPAPRSRSRLPVIVVLLVAAVGIVWWVLAGRGGSVLVETDVARRPPSAAAASTVLDASGYVVARRQATVSSEITGKVMEVLVEEGMQVEAGQVVARLEDTTQQAQLALSLAQAEAARAALAETEARLRNARQERTRTEELAERNLASQASLDAAVASDEELTARLETGRQNVEVAESNVDLARDALANTVIRAPFSGMVVTKNAQPGEMISPVSAGGGFTRTGICTIIDTNSLEIEVDVNEAYIQRVESGQRVQAVLDAYPDWQIPAEVIAIIPTADRQRATVRVRIGFLERDERILRDMGVNVAFLGTEIDESPASIEGVIVPGAALNRDEDGDFVWLVKNGAVERRGVTLGGPSDRPQVLLTRGLAVGDTIVRSSSGPLADGQAVKTD